MLAASNVLFAPALLPTSLVEDVETEKVTEKSMLAVSMLLSNIVLKTAKCWRDGKPKEIDPNPGDGGCQLRGYLLFLFYADQSLREECIKLGEQIATIKEVVNSRNVQVCSHKKKMPGRPGTFFKETFGAISISKRMEFILQCALLATTRAPYERLTNGIVNTRSEVSLLSKLSKNIATISTQSRNKIVEVAQARLSANSVELLRIEASKVTSLKAQEKEHLLYMLSAEKTRVYSPNPKYEAKTFGCLFYEYLAISCRQREERNLVCFKSIVPAGSEPFRILMQSSKPGEEFSVLPDMPQGELAVPVVVFEGVVDPAYDRAKFAKKISEIDFTKLILAAAAIEAPYERTSKLSDLEDEAAQKEIEQYRGVAKDCQLVGENPLLIVDHVYFNLLSAEVGDA